MVIIHIANIDASVIGGVQTAVPQMVKAQSQYASVGLINTNGSIISDVKMLTYNGKFELETFPEPFNHPDLVVFHEVYRIEYIKIYKSLLKSNVPYIIIPHGCLSRQAQKRKFLKKFMGNALLFESFIKRAHAIQYLSLNEERMSAFSAYPSFVAGNGIAVPEKKKTTFFENGIRIVYIGRLEIRTKGLDLLLAATKKNEQLLRNNNVQIEIYGPDYEGVHRILQKAIDKYQISDLVSLGREKMGKEKEMILLSADCFVQTSRTEGLPMGPLEALSYGLPCIVTNGVGLGELIESFGAGYQCETSSEGIAKAVELFLDGCENTESMSRAAVQLIETEFDRSLVSKETVDRYSELLNNGY